MLEDIVTKNFVKV